MKIDRSLEEIDIARLLSFLLLFVVICTLLIFTLIIPSIRHYKEAKIVNNDKIVNLNKIQQVYQARKTELSDLRTQNSKSLLAMKNTFSETKFNTAAEQYFTDVKLTRLPKEDTNETFLRYELNVVADVRSPNNFYNFLDFINNYDNVIKVDFPITMTSTNTNKINISFKIKIYKGN